MNNRNGITDTKEQSCCDTCALMMLSKSEVAERLGMTVSWLDNSQSVVAKQIRSAGIRYGTGRTSPVRYPLRRIIEILSEA